MSQIHRFRTTMLGLAAVVNVVVCTPAHAQDTEHVLTMAPVSSALDPRVVTAQQALLAGDLGSMQEEALLAVISASTSPAEADAVTARRVLIAQQALASTNLGSMQEEALSAIVVAGSAANEAEGGR